MTSVVEALFERSADAFRADAWPDRTCFQAGSPARAARLGALVPEALHAPAAFLAAHPGVAWLHRVDPDRYDHDEAVGPARAAERLAGGEMFDVRDVQTWLPEAAHWLAQLARELGTRERAAYCHAFVSPRGSGVPKHFDNREVFVVQISGTKRWELAPNTALPCPLAPHVVGGSVHALNKHAASALAEPELRDATVHVLEPGAALFVPRGMWHRTQALDDSLSLSFGLRTPSRVEVLLEALGVELGRDPVWRAPAYDPARLPRATLDAIRAAVARLREG